MKPRLVVATPKELLHTCASEVTRTFPLESGGVLMGQQIGEHEWIVDHIVGPGPNAVHGRYRFSPDLPWQHEQIADRFSQTNGRSTYLGDWHSHPRAIHGQLSGKDRKALKRIITTPEAQCESPLMMILWSGAPKWHVSVWNACLMRGYLWGVRLSVNMCELARTGDP